ncbi:sugar dehydrogenase complex small subunit [Neorhizobium galegae]|uniref:Membrane bound FAD containing D-sorbitol dehydrogenase n=1 Tax=Neorhizobium galegae bv. orientalis str. HAMBI 540 TaxID=1028800 RepID=A0A068T081_NEOGA|nr:sugar dehydrogenase complex small subunit [Neorhizobium galegae]MCQ1854182.1 sorbitol dehydrogenase family protein [Neorhizobium galegae]CDN51852.1 Membrane bound FAD containing D-sorbitol dehydrogenase [Neorhizobium galegae bv. orientalis str. HAMBI 540]
MPFDPSSPAMFGQTLSRRSLLRGTAALGGLALAASLGAPLSAAAADDAVASFTQLSEFLTGYTLDPVLGARFLAALKKRDADLDASLAALSQLIKQSGVANMDGFLALTGTDPALTKTATKIVSAWYLGVVGEPEDAELITYAESLMYRPTKGLLTVPSYGPGPNAWGPKPGSKI